MGHLHLVEKDHVFQLHGVAHHGPGPHQGAAPDEGTVADLRFRADDAGAGDGGSGGHPCGAGDPDLLPPLLVYVGGQGGAQGPDEVLDLRQGLPGIVKARQQRRGERMAQIKQCVGTVVHGGIPPVF